MRNLAPSPSISNRSSEIDSAIGQIDLIGESGEIVRSWRIRSPKCTLGSAPDCSVQLLTVGVAPLHATLIFGKKHTLLRSAGPTRISNRHVREWLIDEPTEIVVGQNRLVIHPSIGVLATVVHAENLIDQAARLCKEQVPIVVEPSEPFFQHPKTQLAAASQEIVEPDNPSKLESIERLLLSLQSTLDKLQESIDVESKNANETIVESVTQEIDEFGKRLFSNLNDQLSTQSGVQQSLISNLADRFTNQLGAIDEQLNSQSGLQQSLITGIAERITNHFGSIDEQLNRFSDASNLQTSSLNDLLAQANAEKELIETRFNEVLSNRNELLEAIQILRSEITIAYESPPLQNRAASSESTTWSSESKSAILPGASSSVTDEQLAHSLELAQNQIRLLNSKLRDLETERDSAQLLVTNLTQSSDFKDTKPSDPESALEFTDGQLPEFVETQYPDSHHLSPQYEDLIYETPQHAAVQFDSPQFEIPQQYETQQYETQQYEAQQYEAQQYEAQQYEAQQYEAQQYETQQYETQQYETQQYEAQQYEAQQYEAQQYEEAPSGMRQLPAWFKQDEPRATSDGYASDFARLDNSPAQGDFEQLSSPLDLKTAVDDNPFAKPEEKKSTADASQSNLDSISDRLQRMLEDAGQRRSANPPSEPLTTRSWSQKYGNQSAVSEDPVDSPDGANRNHSVEEFPAVSPANDEPANVGASFPQREEVADSGVQAAQHSSLLRHLYRDEQTELPFIEPVKSSFESNEQSVNEDRDDEIPNDRGSSHSKTMNEKGGGNDEEESIELYMQRLLHRVRGGEGEQGSAPVTATKTPATMPTSSVSPTKHRSRVAASMGLEINDSEFELPEERPREELFVPRQQAPEQRNDLDALRELANTNARRAITRSDIRRTNSAFYLKLCVTAVAVSSAVALFLFNGLTLNAPFIGMLAAIIVAFLWGYDCVNHFKRLQNVGGMNKVTAAETAAGQSIRVSSTEEESGWRPTPT